MILCYTVARLLGALAEAEAMALCVPMSIAVADAEGGLVVFARMDGSLPASREIAVSKAYTAAVLRMATDEVGKRAQPGGQLYGIQHTHTGKMVLFGGGLPLRLRGKVVGAIGISGGTPDEDVQIARFVVEALEEMESWARFIRGVLPETRLGERPAHRLEAKLGDVLQEMHHPLSPRGHCILAGALILAAREDQ
jgi:uncharacterized protein GlcG (DUF336 family)